MRACRLESSSSAAPMPGAARPIRISWPTGWDLPAAGPPTTYSSSKDTLSVGPESTPRHVTWRAEQGPRGGGTPERPSGTYAHCEVPGVNALTTGVLMNQSDTYAPAP